MRASAPSPVIFFYSHIEEGHWSSLHLCGYWNLPVLCRNHLIVCCQGLVVDQTVKKVIPFHCACSKGWCVTRKDVYTVGNSVATSKSSFNNLGSSRSSLPASCLLYDYCTACEDNDCTSSSLSWLKSLWCFLACSQHCTLPIVVDRFPKQFGLLESSDYDAILVQFFNN